MYFSVSVKRKRLRMRKPDAARRPVLTRDLPNADLFRIKARRPLSHRNSQT